MKEEYWLKDAGKYFTYEPFSEITEGFFIFGLYQDTETWTGFYEDLVRYKYLGKRNEIEYSELNNIFHTHLLETGKEGLTNRVESNGHIIWVVNKYIYAQALSFVGFMSDVIAAIEKYGDEFSWYTEDSD